MFPSRSNTGIVTTFLVAGVLVLAGTVLISHSLLLGGQTSGGSPTCTGGQPHCAYPYHPDCAFGQGNVVCSGATPTCVDNDLQPTGGTMLCCAQWYCVRPPPMCTPTGETNYTAEGCPKCPIYDCGGGGSSDAAGQSSSTDLISVCFPVSSSSSANSSAQSSNNSSSSAKSSNNSSSSAKSSSSSSKKNDCSGIDCELGARNVCLAMSPPAGCHDLEDQVNDRCFECYGLCGNHELDAPDEECDDGNTQDNDGCDYACKLEGTFCENGSSSSGGGSASSSSVNGTSSSAASSGAASSASSISSGGGSDSGGSSSRGNSCEYDSAISDSSCPHPHASIQEFTVPTADSKPIRIASGPDGSFWFTELNAAKIGRVYPSGTITEYPVSAGYRAMDITAGPDDNMWYVTNKIVKITPSGTQTEYSVPGNYSLWRITAGPDGNLWFTAEGTGQGAIGNITPSGVVTMFPMGNMQPSGIAAGSDGKLWFSPQTQPYIYTVTTDGVLGGFELDCPLQSASELVKGPDGNIWASGGNGAGNSYKGSFLKITPSGVITEYNMPHPGTEEITVGADGNLWQTGGGGNSATGYLYRLKLDGSLTEFTVNIGQNYLNGIAAGSDGSIWVTNTNKNTIGKVTTSCQ